MPRIDSATDMTIGENIFVGEDFRFRVEYYDGEFDPDSRGYEVSLPHQCDGWVVSYVRDKDAVAERLRDFIREAEAALEALEAHDG